MILFATTAAAQQPTSTPHTSSPVTNDAEALANAVVPDPAIRRGVLANGLHYAVMTNATPKGGVSLRLGVHVGGFDEADNERGAAHFIEHMAFSLGRNAHEAGDEAAFAAAGVAFGRDHNAETGLFSTIYRLDMPQSDAASLDLAFGWLRGVADGTSFTKDAVDRERGVILSEYEARLTPETKVNRAIAQFEGPGLRTVEGDVMGSIASLRALDADGLRGFHQRWYRPDNAVLVVVGDLPIDILEARVRRAFGGWAPRAGPMQRRPVTVVDPQRGQDALVVESAQTATNLRICRVRAADAQKTDDIAHEKQRMLSNLWVDILNLRLTALAQMDAPPFLAAEAYSASAEREAAESCVEIKPMNEAWEPGLIAVETELSRFSAHPPTETELETAIEARRANARGDLSRAETRKSADMATTIVEQTLTGDVISSPAESFRTFNAAVEDVTPADVRAAFERDWSGAGPFISLTAPTPPPSSALLAAWKKASLHTATPPADATSATWTYTDFGPAGHVAKRQVFQTPAFVRLTFENGVVMNFKETHFELQTVKIRIRLGAGRDEIDRHDYATAQLGAAFFQVGGLGRHDFADIKRFFDRTGLPTALEVKDHAFLINSVTNSSSLKAQLQLITAYLSDPGFRSWMDSRLPTAFDAMYRAIRAEPIVALSEALTAAVEPDGHLNIPPKDQLLRLHMKDFERLLKPVMTQAPIEITIVGDINEAQATQFVAGTLGALPKRSDGPRPRADSGFVRYANGDFPEIHATHDGPADKAAVGAVWPLYVAVPERRREEVALILLAAIFNDQLRHRIRQELGMSYAPQVETHTPDRADQGYLEAVIETTPADTEVVLRETRNLAARLAQGGFSEADLEEARRPILSELTSKAQTNDWWLEGLDGSARTNEGIDEMMTLRDLIAASTLQDIRKAAADWLHRSPIVVIVTPSAKSASATMMPSVTPKETAK